MEASESSEARQDNQEAGFVKVDVEEANEIAESVQQELVRIFHIISFSRTDKLWPQLSPT